MKSGWWIAASFLVALVLLLQPGCGNQGDLESAAEEQLEADDAMTEDMEMPE